MTYDQEYALAIALYSTTKMVESLKTTNLKRTALYHCQQAQAIRRELKGATA